MTTNFPLFRLPFLAVKEVIKVLNPYELFALSIQSDRSSRIVKVVLSKRKFKLSLFLNCPGGLHLLQLETEHASSKCLQVGVIPLDGRKTPSNVLTFPGISLRVPASVDFSILTEFNSHWEDHNTGAHFLLRYICQIFPIDSIDVCYNAKDRTLADVTNAILKELKLRIKIYRDEQNDYTFEQVESVLSFTMSNLYIKYPRMEFEKFVPLFKKYMAGNTSITMSNPPEIMNLQPLIELFDERPRLYSNDDFSHFRFRRIDGKGSLVTSKKERVVFYHDHQLPTHR